MPSIDSTAERIVNAVKEEGICVITEPQSIGLPPFNELTDLWSQNNKKGLYLAGLENNLLNIVEHCIGQPPGYHGVYCRKDQPDTPQTTKGSDRFFHLDTEDFGVVKIIVYMGNVGPNDRPFEYISIEDTNDLNFSKPFLKRRFDDTQVEPIVGKSKWKQITGKAGTVIVVATTSIYHRGGLHTGSDRETIFFDYSSRKPLLPWNCGQPNERAEVLEYIQGCSQRQWDTALWRERSVPRLAQLIETRK
jgi:hypothetical protein